MPYVFQKEIGKNNPHHTGCEKFDSLYRLYDIFKDPAYFFVNLFFGENEHLEQSNIKLFLESNAKEYQISHYVVRCEKKSETQPVAAIAFSDICLDENLEKCTNYIYNRLNQGYNCIVHEVISGNHPSNRLDWLYSFGIWYKDTLPQIEIYPATDASSIKWGKLSPLDFLTIDSDFDVKHTTLRNENALKEYQSTKITEWVQKFKDEISEENTFKSIFTDEEKLAETLKNEKHPLFDLSQIDSSIRKTKKQLVDIALQYRRYALEKNIDLDQTIVHGSLLFNNRMIIWDISSNKRWQYLNTGEK